MISTNALASITKTLKKEGGYVNHKDDLGGETNLGITKAVARAHGYEGEMKDLPRDVAIEIYYDNYWKVNKLDSFEDDELAYMVYDFGVNGGTRTSIKILQEAYNMYRKDCEGEIVVDGRIGRNTLNAINSVKHPDRLRDLFKLGVLNRYYDITKARKQNRKFIIGWIRRWM